MRLSTALFGALIVLGTTSLHSAPDTVSAPLKDYLPSQLIDQGIAYSRDAGSRVEVCGDSAIRVYDLATDALIRTIRIPSGFYRLAGSSYDPDGFLVLERDSVFVRVDMSTGQVARIPAVTALWNPRPIHYSDSYSRAIVHGADSSHYLVDMRTGVVRKCFAGSRKVIDYAGFTADDSKIIVLRSADSSAQLWDAGADTLLFARKLPTKLFNKAAFTPDGLGVAVALNTTRTRGFALLDLATGIPTQVDTSMNCNLGYYASPKETDFLFSKDGARIIFGTSLTVSAFSFPIILCRETDTRPEEHFSFGSQGRWVGPGDSLVFSPLFDYGSKTYELRELNIRTGKKKVRFSKQERPMINYTGFSAQGDPILTGPYNYSFLTTSSGVQYADTVLFWNALTGREILRRTGWGASSEAVYRGTYEHYFSPDGNRIFERKWRTTNSRDRLQYLKVLKINPDLQGPDSLLFANKNGFDPLLAQDRRSVCTFDSATATVHDLVTGDSTNTPFKLKKGWVPWAVHPELDIAFACSTFQAGSTDYAVYFIQSMRFRSQDSLGPRQSHGVEWIFDDHHGSWPAPVVTADGQRMLVTTNRGSKLIEIRSGKWIASLPNNGAEAVLSPDGQHFLLDDRCYSALSGELERVYPESYYNYTPVFNPRNGHQFILGARLYELPGPPSAAISVREGRARPWKTTGRWKGPVAVLEWPEGAGTEAWLSVQRPDGRQVFRQRLTRLGARRTLVIPALAQGGYTYRLESPVAGSAGPRFHFLP